MGLNGRLSLKHTVKLKLFTITCYLGEGGGDPNCQIIPVLGLDL